MSDFLTRRAVHRFLVLLCCLGLAGTAWGGWSEDQKLMALDGRGGDFFGCAVDIHGSLALVGADRDDNNIGAAYLYRFDGEAWVQLARLTPSDGASGDFFGRAVALQDELAVIGAPSSEGGTGALYVFERPLDGWRDATETVKLVSPALFPGDLFGQSVDLSYETLVVGAPGYSPESVAGAAYVFETVANRWVLSARLAPGDAVMGSCFGRSVAMDGQIVVGDPCNDERGFMAGAAYLFEMPLAGWMDMTETTRLIPAGSTPWAHFGWAVAIDGERAVVGAPFHGIDGAPLPATPQDLPAGSAHLFRWTPEGWAEVAELTPPDGSSGDRFGTAVAISLNRILVGSRQHGALGEKAGAAYLYTGGRKPWSLREKLLPDDGAAGIEFGCSAALYHDRLVLGAHHGAGLEPDAGTAYTFERQRPGGQPSLDVDHGRP